MTNTPENTQKRLFLLDAYALIFRGYYALIKNPRVNSKGMDTSAIMGFMNSLFDVIKREKPDHLAVAFDKGGSSDRVEMYEDYKANRDETPDAIKIAVPYIQSILKAMHVPCIEIEGVEADDLIGTLSKQAEKEGYQVFMVTPDKDYAQLVSENIFMYKPARMGNGIASNNGFFLGWRCACLVEYKVARFSQQQFGDVGKSPHAHPAFAMNDTVMRLGQTEYFERQRI